MSFNRTIVVGAATFAAISAYSTLLAFAEEPPTYYKCAISGRVVDRTTGEGVRNANVKLLDANSPPDGLTSAWDEMTGAVRSGTGATSKYSVDTSYDGTFCFATSEPGMYTVFASKSGYLNSSYVENASTIEMSSRQETASQLLVGIAPLSAISGSVIADGSGDPLMNVNVVAVKRSEAQGRVVFMPVQGTQSGGLGDFRIGKLVPGTYYIYAQPLPGEVAKSSISPVRTYYPTSLTLGASTPIILGIGEESSGVLIRVQSATRSHVAGRVLGPQDVWAGSTVDLHYADEDPMALLYSPNLSEEGAFDFPNVAPGRYLLTVRSTRGGGRRVVDVNSADVTADVQFVPNLTVSGTWRIEGGAPGGGTAPRVDLTPADGVIGSSYVMSVRANGTFSAPGVFPGRYFVKVSVPDGEYLEQLEIGGRESLTGEIDLTTGRSPEIEIKISVGALKLSGNIKAAMPADAEPGYRIRARVILVPRRGRSDGTDIRFSAADGAGHFVFANLAPGDYDVFALLSANGYFLKNAKLLHQVASTLGTMVSVREGGQGNSVELSLLSNEAVATSLRSTGAK